MSSQLIRRQKRDLLKGGCFTAKAMLWEVVSCFKWFLCLYLFYVLFSVGCFQACSSCCSWLFCLAFGWLQGNVFGFHLEVFALCFWVICLIGVAGSLVLVSDVSVFGFVFGLRKPFSLALLVYNG